MNTHDSKPGQGDVIGEKKARKGISRRSLLQGAAAAGLAATLGRPARVYAHTKRRVRIGYLHILSVDAQMWLMKHMGTLQKEGLEPEFVEFHTGIGGFSALVGGSIDFLTTGGVTSNFPARGQGKVVIPNSVEVAGQVWVNPASGIKSIADLKGKQVATTKGTTGEIFLYSILHSAGLSLKDVTILNQDMPAAVTTFVTKNVPAVSIWIPFNLRIQNGFPQAQLLANARSYYPKTGYIITAYSTNNQTYEKDKDLIRRMSAAWGPANEYLLKNPEQSLEILHHSYYKEVPLAEMKSVYKAVQPLSIAQWEGDIKNGTLYRELDHVTNIFVTIGAIKSPLRANQYADFSVFESVYKRAA